LSISFQSQFYLIACTYIHLTYFDIVFCALNNAETHSEKIIKGYANRRLKEEDGKVTYEAKFTVPSSFGEVGAVGVENKYINEMYLEDIVLQGFAIGPVHFNCNSWVQPNDKRTFFTDKVYRWIQSIVALALWPEMFLIRYCQLFAAMATSYHIHPV